MMRKRQAFVAILSPILLAMAPVQAQLSEANLQRISSQLSRLRQLTAAQQGNDSDQQYIERLLQRIQGVEKALAAQRPQLALRRLGPAFIRMEAENQLRGRAAEAGSEALEEELGRLNRHFEGLKKQPQNEEPSSHTALARALAQAVARSAVPYQRSGLQFARASDVPGGVYYLIIARNSLHFSEFCRQIEGDLPLPAIEAAQLEAEQQRLEAATLKAYQQPGAAVQLHSQFIGLNSTLKELRELLTDGALFGALDKALQARLRLSMIEAGSQAHPGRDALAQSSLRVNSLLDGSFDHSIALSYWEEAQELLEEHQPEAEDLKRAGVLMEQVLPLYFRLIQNP